MKTSQFISEYLTHKRALGHGFKTEERTLRAFSKHIGDCPVHCISLERMENFLHAGSTNADSVARKNRVLSGFCQYISGRHGDDLPALPVLPRSSSSSFVPYIYTHEELRGLVQAIEETCQFGRLLIEAHTVRAIILLLYGAGLRRGEALRLNRGDVDLSEAVLMIRQTKFHKNRLVPMGEDLVDVLSQYCQYADALNVFDPDAPFFRMRNGGRVEQFPLQRLWRRLCKRVGVERDGGPRNQPRLHDLRHTAAVHRLIAWYRSGVDLGKALPMLSTYLGHTSIAGTQRYLTLTPELLQEASLRFENYALGECDEQ